MKITQTNRSSQRAGFTLVEIVIAMAVLGAMALGVYIGFSSLNSYAVSSRLYTEAQAVAQNQIDLILSKGPFDPANNKVPKMYNSDGTLCFSLDPGTYTKQNVFVYRDPINGGVVVSGTMTTTISDPGFTMTFAGATTNLNIRKANVQVSYRFRNTNYVVSMDTFRTSDL